MRVPSPDVPFRRFRDLPDASNGAAAYTTPYFEVKEIALFGFTKP
jgi:hypothetical protein